MTNDVVGRIAALEGIAMTALGLHLANARNDPGYKKSGALFATMRGALKTQAATLPTEAQKLVINYGNNLLDAVKKRTGHGAGRAAN